LGEVKKSPPQVPLFPGEKSSPAGATAPPPELSPATGEKRGGGREGKEKGGYGRGGPRENKGLPVNGFGSASPLRVATCNRVRLVSFPRFSSKERKGAGVLGWIFAIFFLSSQ